MYQIKIQLIMELFDIHNFTVHFQELVVHL